MDTNIGLLILMVIGGGAGVDHKPLSARQLPGGHHLEDLPEIPLWIQINRLTKGPHGPFFASA